MKSTVLIIAALFGHALWAGRASFSVCVLDADTGLPIKGVKIEGAFLNYSRGWNASAKDNNVDAWTDSSGHAKLSGNTEAGVGGYRILRTPGYYNAEWTEIEFRERSMLRLGAWIPSDIVSTARLDRVVNPIPLFVKKAVGEYRKREQWYYFLDADYHEVSKLDVTNDVPVVKDVILSYDLLKGAYLPPYGDGEKADVVFTFNETFYTWDMKRGGPGVSLYKKFKMDMAVDFPGGGNGLCEVSYAPNAGILLRTAPSEGYSTKLTRWYARHFGEHGKKTNYDKKRCYAFRIRTKYDDRGNVESAFYGKIYGDFNIQDIDGVEFLYYLNQTMNDRNLEWDMKNNLCPDPGGIGNPKP